MRFLILSIILTAACATTVAKQERVFWVGNNICYQNQEKTLCTIADDPNDPVHLTDGVEREIEQPKPTAKNWNWTRKF